MTQPSAVGPCAGWFGKIPSLGDFVQRNLPPSFVEPWDAWLSQELSHSQRALGEHWAESWRHAPAWCFCLGAGVLDQRSWQGLLLPSLDRVGREFPLTIAVSAGPHAARHRPAGWWTVLLTIGRRALEPAGSADELDEALAALMVDRAILPGGDADASPERESDACAPGSGAGSAWWRAGAVADRGDARRVLLAGLPRGREFLALLEVSDPAPGSAGTGPRC